MDEFLIHSFSYGFPTNKPSYAFYVYHYYYAINFSSYAGVRIAHSVKGSLSYITSLKL